MTSVVSRFPRLLGTRIGKYAALELTLARCMAFSVTWDTWPFVEWPFFVCKNRVPFSHFTSGSVEAVDGAKSAVMEGKNRVESGKDGCDSADILSLYYRPVCDIIFWNLNQSGVD